MQCSPHPISAKIVVAPQYRERERPALLLDPLSLSDPLGGTLTVAVQIPASLSRRRFRRECSPAHAIAPDKTYELRASTDGVNFTAPLPVQTVPAPSAGSWADIVGEFDNGSQTWSPPNGFVNFNDIDAAVK